MSGTHTAAILLLLLTACGSLPVVFPRADAGRSCSATSACAAPLVCDPSGECVECLTDAHCVGAFPACDPTTKRCVACRDDVGCTSPEVCSATSPVCVRPCNTSMPGACAGYAGGCRGNVCAACVVDDDCGGNKHCDSSVGRCVLCLDDGHCGGNTPHCEQASGTCVACVVNGDCGATGSCFQGNCR